MISNETKKKEVEPEEQIEDPESEGEGEISEAITYRLLINEATTQTGRWHITCKIFK